MTGMAGWETPPTVCSSRISAIQRTSTDPTVKLVLDQLDQVLFVLTSLRKWCRRIDLYWHIMAMVMVLIGKSRPRSTVVQFSARGHSTSGPVKLNRMARSWREGLLTGSDLDGVDTRIYEIYRLPKRAGEDTSTVFRVIALPRGAATTLQPSPPLQPTLPLPPHYDDDGDDSPYDDKLTPMSCRLQRRRDPSMMVTTIRPPPRQLNEKDGNDDNDPGRLALFQRQRMTTLASSRCSHAIFSPG
ncbi:hypothetical protein J3A83DRAFT_1707186 [Scleroderma citrinum]